MKSDIQIISERFVSKFTEVMESQESMESYYVSKFPTALDRTADANRLVFSIFADIFYDVCKFKPVNYDGVVLAKHLAKYKMLDPVLLSQCILNLQSFPQYNFDSKDLAHRLMADLDNLPEDVPAEMRKFAKLDKSNSPWSVAYNNVVNKQANLNIFNKFDANVSWRLTPKHKTPAMTDSKNLSSLRIGFTDFMKMAPNLSMVNYHFEDKTMPSEVDPKTGGIRFPGIDYSFFSESGGDILPKSVLSRSVACKVYAHPSVVNIIPRLGSLTVIFNSSISVEEMTKLIDEAVAEVTCG